MNFFKSIIVCSLIFVFTTTSAQVDMPCNMNAENESEFYTDTTPAGAGITIYPTGVENGDDSQNLQNAINTYAGVKKIILKPQNGKNVFYLRNIQVISGTHIRIHKNVTIRTRREDKKTKSNVGVFDVGRSGSRVSGFSITSFGDDNDPAERFTVDMRQLTPRVLSGTNQTEPEELSGESFITVANAENFKISNFNITDNYSRISTLTFSLNLAGEKNHFLSVLDSSVYPEQDRTPEKGLIKNITATNAHAGYGLVQIQAAVGLLFKNLEGTGGVPLRLETGLGKVIITKDRTLDGVYGRNIVANNGLSAVDIAPHNADQGCVDMENILANGCTYTIRIDEGFEDNKEEKVNTINSALMSDTDFFNLVSSVKFDRPNTSGGVTEVVKTSDVNKFFGTFEHVKLKNIQGKGGLNAQLKTKFLKFYDKDTRDVYNANYSNGSINLDMETVPSKSLSVVKYSADPSLDNCNCGSNPPSENGCFQVLIASLDNNFVNLNRGGNGIAKSGIDKIMVDANESTDQLFYTLSNHTATSASGWLNSERPALISSKTLDQLFGNAVKPCKDDPSLSFDEIDDRESFIGPNPTTGILHVNNKEKGEVKVYNVLGALLQVVNKYTDRLTIDLTNNIPGVYILDLNGKKARIVKQ